MALSAAPSSSLHACRAGCFSRTRTPHAPLLHRGPHIRRSRAVVSAAAAAGDAPARVMQLHLMETSLNVPCCSDRVKVLEAGLEALLAEFQSREADARPRKLNSLDVSHEDGASATKLAVFCNPNMFAQPYQAKVMVTLTCTNGIKVLADGLLTTLRADLENFKATAK